MASSTALEHALAYRDHALLAPRPLPDWARALIALGDFAGRQDSCEGRIVIAVTVPTRSFAAALIAAGSILARNEALPTHVTDVEAHFTSLSRLPVGAPVRLISGNTIRQGEYLGVYEAPDGIPRVRVQAGPTRHHLPAQESVRVQPCSGMSCGVRPQAIATTPLLEACLGPERARHFVTESRLDCVLIGATTALLDDLKSQEFAPACGGSSATLQELIRAVEANPPGAPSRARVVSAFAGETMPIDELPPLVIFDGARAFLGFRQHFSASHRIAVIDRSREDAEDAAIAFNAEYAGRAADALSPAMSSLLADIAPSLEISAFRMRP